MAIDEVCECRSCFDYTTEETECGHALCVECAYELRKSQCPVCGCTLTWRTRTIRLRSLNLCFEAVCVGLFGTAALALLGYAGYLCTV